VSSRHTLAFPPGLGEDLRHQRLAYGGEVDAQRDRHLLGGRPAGETGGHERRDERARHAERPPVASGSPPCSLQRPFMGLSRWSSHTGAG